MKRWVWIAVAASLVFVPLTWASVTGAGVSKAKPVPPSAREGSKRDSRRGRTGFVGGGFHSGK